jgi:hypothetical protein
MPVALTADDNHMKAESQEGEPTEFAALAMLVLEDTKLVSGQIASGYRAREAGC